MGEIVRGLHAGGARHILRHDRGLRMSAEIIRHEPRIEIEDRGWDDQVEHLPLDSSGVCAPCLHESPREGGGEFGLSSSGHGARQPPALKGDSRLVIRIGGREDVGDGSRALRWIE